VLNYMVWVGICDIFHRLGWFGSNVTDLFCNSYYTTCEVKKVGGSKLQFSDR